jgi:hypothetical protein
MPERALGPLLERAHPSVEFSARGAVGVHRRGGWLVVCARRARASAALLCAGRSGDIADDLAAGTVGANRPDACRRLSRRVGEMAAENWSFGNGDTQFYQRSDREGTLAPSAS